jgi:uncharacterized protein (DUF779 family)
MQRASVVLTDNALEVLARVRDERHDGLSLVIGNGCCDSTAPFLFANYLPGPNELLVAEVADVPVFLDKTLEHSFAGTEIVIDAQPDRQSDSFSCEAELGYRLCLERLPAAESIGLPKGM